MTYLFLGLIWAIVFCGSGLLLRINKFWVITQTFVAFILGTFFAYLTTPVIGLFETGFWTFLLFPIIISGIITFFSLIEAYSDDDKKGAKISLSLTSFSVISFLAFSFFTTSSMFHSQDYYNLLNVAEETEFNPTEVLLDQTQARFVDQDLSVRSANEVLGQVRGMGSRFEIGSMRIQNINDELRWVAPFEHSSIFKWMDNNTSPGYVSVSASDYSKSKMIIDNSNINYGNSGFYFSKHIPRHLYTHGYSTTLFDDFTLEIDNEGKPYWVASIIERKVGFSGKMATGIVVVNAENGDIEEFSIDNAPEWVDRIQPEHITESLISYWGQYSNGWWNSFAVGNGVITATPNSSIVFTKDKKSMWYTGMQSKSTSNKESTMGFMMVDSRTGEATFYQRSGITENVAKTAIEGRVQEAEYKSSNPIPYNINGEITFLSILKDKNGNVQGIGLVAYDNRSKVTFGESFDIALRRYMSAIADTNGTQNLNSSMKSISINGVVERSYLQNVDNRLVLTFTLKSDSYKGLFFITQADENKNAMLTRDNDEVSFESYSLDNESIQVFNFKNSHF
jgi:hypothetical protein